MKDINQRGVEQLFNLRASDECQGNIQFPLVASTVCSTLPVQVLGQVHKTRGGGRG